MWVGKEGRGVRKPSGRKGAATMSLQRKFPALVLEGTLAAFYPLLPYYRLKIMRFRGEKGLPRAPCSLQYRIVPVDKKKKNAEFLSFVIHNMFLPFASALFSRTFQTASHPFLQKQRPMLSPLSMFPFPEFHCNFPHFCNVCSDSMLFSQLFRIS